jgi:L-cystine uptake protein TcyP (sodium:dicarboxylate symporter family)
MQPSTPSTKRRRWLALLLGIVVWAITFAATFTWSVYVVEGAWTVYIYLLFLPQVLSSIIGTITFVAVRGTLSNISRRGVTFALATCSASAFAGVLTVLLLDREAPGGWEFAAMFALVLVVVLVVDGLVAALGGRLASDVARRFIGARTSQ